MKIYAYYKGDKFTVNHNKEPKLNESVFAIWLDIQSKELTINYNKNIDILNIKPETNMYIQIFNNKGIVDEAYMLRTEEKSRDNQHITYKLKHANCYLEFDDNDDLHIYDEISDD